MAEKFQFKGFVPTYQEQELAQDLLEKIEQSAPSQSAGVAQISLTENGYDGYIKISSEAGVFEAHDCKQNLESLLEILYENIGKEIQHWKDTRVISA